jgi:hypothetical protein
MAYPQWYVIDQEPYDTGEVNNEGEEVGIEIENWPAHVEFFTTEQAANNFSVQHGGIGTKSPTTATSKAANSAVSTAANATGINGITGLINFLQQSSIWTRLAEFAIGGILFYIGMKSIATPAGQQPAKQTIKSTAKNIAKVAK